MSYFVVRINQSKTSPKNITTDFEKFLSEINQVGKAKWDKDSKNKLQLGDFLGFILNDGLVHFFRVTQELGNEYRETYWNHFSSYRKGNGNNLPCEREVIVLSNKEYFTIEWNLLKKNAGYKENYMPRGTTRIRNRALISL